MSGLRNLLACAALSCLAACGTVIETDDAFGQAVEAFTTPEVDDRFVRLLEAGAPVLQLGFVGRPEDASTLLLERRRGAFSYWLSADAAQLILERGMLHGTRGLGEGLLASELSEPMALIFASRSGVADRFHTYLDGNDRAVTRTYRCEVRMGEVRTIALTGGSVLTRLMRETCRSLDQEFENLYWVDLASNRIVLSRQWAGPFLGSISTRLVP